MQFSKKVVDLSKLYNIEPKDVLFALLATAGASTAEAFAVIHRPACSTSNARSASAPTCPAFMADEPPITDRPGTHRHGRHSTHGRAHGTT